MASSESQSFLLKKGLKAKTISEVMCQYPVVICISRYNKIAGFWQQNIHSNRYHGVCHVIYILFGSYFLLKAMYSKFCCCGICVQILCMGLFCFLVPLSGLEKVHPEYGYYEKQNLELVHGIKSNLLASKAVLNN